MLQCSHLWTACGDLPYYARTTVECRISAESTLETLPFGVQWQKRAEVTERIEGILRPSGWLFCVQGKVFGNGNAILRTEMWSS
jgi:hypothetical protein